VVAPDDDVLDANNVDAALLGELGRRAVVVKPVVNLINPFSAII
jgi:hypothetical protein